MGLSHLTETKDATAGLSPESPFPATAMKKTEGRHELGLDKSGRSKHNNRIVRLDCWPGERPPSKFSVIV